MSSLAKSECLNAELVIQGRRSTLVSNLEDLRCGLQELDKANLGEIVTLTRGPEDYIKAVRHREGWAVTTRRGSYFTLAAFTASMTTEYSEQQARRRRKARPIRERIAHFLFESPLRSLTFTQVETLFSEYLLAQKFSIPQAGA